MLSMAKVVLERLSLHALVQRNLAVTDLGKGGKMMEKAQSNDSDEVTTEKSRNLF